MQLETLRVPSRVANLASKFDCSNPYSFRYMRAFVIFSNKNIPEIIIAPFCSGAVSVISMVANLASNYDCSISCSFWDMTCCMISSKIFRKLQKRIKKFEILNFVVSYCEKALTSRKMQILRSNATAQITVVFEMWWLLCLFSKLVKGMSYK